MILYNDNTWLFVSQVEIVFPLYFIHMYHRDRDRIIFGFTTTYAMSAYHHERCSDLSHAEV
jgi:hypothetical protein